MAQHTTQVQISKVINANSDKVVGYQFESPFIDSDISREDFEKLISRVTSELRVNLFGPQAAV